jgi:ectoine hydroxylase-related dioxygenase (phytanoyl-CoA dioxygenase family)
VRFDSSLEHAYREQGAAMVRGAVAPEHLELLARGVERNIEHPSRDSYHRFEGGEGRGAFVYDYGCHRWIPEYIEFARVSGLAEVAARLLSSQRVCFFDDSYFIKQPGSEIPAPWHHDFTYYEIDGEILVAWIPLDPHGEYETLRLVAGSHRWDKRFDPVMFDPKLESSSATPTSSAYDSMPDIDNGEYEILAWEVEPGDCIFFNGLTLHSSRGNPTSRAQRRFNCRFVDEGVRYTPRPEYPWGDGKANADVRPGQRLSEDPESFPVLWEARS